MATEGGQPGNVNAVRHGHRSKRHGVVLARLGRRFRGAYVDVLKLRLQVEILLRQRYGELSLIQVGRVQTLARLEQSARALELTIRETPSMPAEELRGARHSICSWSRERDNILTELLGGKAVNGSDVWATLEQPQAQPAPEHQPAAESDSGGLSGDVAPDGEGSPE
ncbi:MAG: hypothetical protein ABIP48_09780 [Planctomycetota bacterium]